MVVFLDRHLMLRLHWPQLCLQGVRTGEAGGVLPALGRAWQRQELLGGCTVGITPEQQMGEGAGTTRDSRPLGHAARAWGPHASPTASSCPSIPFCLGPPDQAGAGGC